MNNFMSICENQKKVYECLDKKVEQLNDLCSTMNSNMPQLTNNICKSKKNLVFTSAGDKTNFVSNWLSNKKTFDIWVVYYGNSTEDKYKESVDYWNRRKGSKFQNFHYIYNTYPDIINKYEKIFILDDDIIFDENGIQSCFEMSYQYNLWLLQPSFKRESKISHKITVKNPYSILRYTNFVEENTPLIDTYVLKDIMNLYDCSISSWGIDFIISHVLTKHSEYNESKIAILDNISCINPEDNIKGGREMLNFNSDSVRIKIYRNFANEKNILFNVKSIKEINRLYKLYNIKN
jgi:hypothetical protein